MELKTILAIVVLAAAAVVLVVMAVLAIRSGNRHRNTRTTPQPPWDHTRPGPNRRRHPASTAS